MRWISWLPLVALLGCGAPSPGLSAEVVSVAALESGPSARVAIRWRNPSSRPARIERYRLEWPGGAIDVAPDGATIAPGGSVVRTLRVDATHGDVRGLTRENARVVDARASSNR